MLSSDQTYDSALKCLRVVTMVLVPLYVYWYLLLVYVLQV